MRDILENVVLSVLLTPNEDVGHGMDGTFESIDLCLVGLEVEPLDKVDVVTSVIQFLRHVLKAVVLNFDCHCNWLLAIIMLTHLGSQTREDHASFFSFQLKVASCQPLGFDLKGMTR